MAVASPSVPRRTFLGGTLVLAFLVLVLAWQLAYWFWHFVAPPPRVAVTTPGTAIDMAAIARLFGAAPPAGSAATATAGSGLRLKGVVAPTPGIAASAIFSTGAGRD